MRSGSTRVRGAVQPVDALDAQRRGADAVDLGAHLDEAIGDVADLRLARGVLDHGLALGKRRRHQHGMGGADRDLGKAISPPRRPFGALATHIAAVDVDLGAELP